MYYSSFSFLLFQAKLVKCKIIAMAASRHCSSSLSSLLSVPATVRSRRHRSLFQCIRQAPNPKPHLLHRRPFTSSSRNAKSAVKMVRHSNLEKPSKAPSTAQAEAQRDMDIPQDVGLIPGTFIYPRGANRPSWLEDRGRQRFAIEWERLRSKFFNAYTYEALPWPFPLILQPSQAPTVTKTRLLMGHAAGNFTTSSSSTAPYDRVPVLTCPFALGA